MMWSQSFASKSWVCLCNLKFIWTTWSVVWTSENSVIIKQQLCIYSRLCNVNGICTSCECSNWWTARPKNWMSILKKLSFCTFWRPDFDVQLRLNLPVMWASELTESTTSEQDVNMTSKKEKNFHLQIGKWCNLNVICTGHCAVVRLRAKSRATCNLVDE